MSDIELCYMPAVEQLKLFKTGKLSPLEVLKAQIDRAEKVEPAINAFTDTFFEEASKMAKAAQELYANRPDEARPLEGLSVAIKDEMPVVGQRCTEGSLIYKDQYMDFDHPVAERLRDAGGIFHARTTTPEFCSAWITSSRLHGDTGTPWNPKYTASGSSGGSGASLAAGTSSLATGSDIGGSIRGPAAACGVVGFKPPYGRNPDLPPFSLDSYNHTGPLARTVADCALMQNTMSGVHPKDIATVREEVLLAYDYGDLSGKKIAFSMDVGNGVVAQEVEDLTRQALDNLATRGAIIEEVDLGWGRDEIYAARDYLDHLFGQYLVRAKTEHADLLCDYNLYYADRAAASSPDDFLRSYEVSGQMYNTMGPLLEEYYAFICPIFISHEMRADQKPWEKMTVKGVEFDSDYDGSLMAQFNMLSRLPVLAVPAGIADNGLPVGLQIVGRSYDDARVFHVASALEKVAPWLDSPERRPPL